MEKAGAGKAVILEIPMARWGAGEHTGEGAKVDAKGPEECRVGRCEYLTVDGRECRAAAVEGWSYCKRHQRWYEVFGSLMKVPYPEDAVSLQEVVAWTIGMVLDRHIDAGQANAIASLCRVLARNLPAYRREVERDEQSERVVRRIQ